MNNEFTKAPFLLKLVSLCIGAAEKASKLIRDVVKKGDLQVINKAKEGLEDLQTEADRLSQLCIIGKLRECFPLLKVIGEEGELKDTFPKHYLSEIVPNEAALRVKCPPDYYHFDQSDLVVWVDPLDGTGSFAKGIYHQVVICIGIATNEGESIAGILNQPYFCDIPIEYDTLTINYNKAVSRNVWGIYDVGVFGLENRENYRKGNRVVLVSKSHFIQTDQQLASSIDPDYIINTSGAAYKSLCVLEKEADVLLYSSGGTKKWDTCAVDVLFKILGGNLTDLYGNKINYSPNQSFSNKNGIVASITNHSEYVNKIKMSMPKVE